MGGELVTEVPEAKNEVEVREEEKERARPSRPNSLPPLHQPEIGTFGFIDLL
jgi:hypothetical protein